MSVHPSPCLRPSLNPASLFPSFTLTSPLSPFALLKESFYILFKKQNKTKNLFQASLSKWEVGAYSL